MVAPELGCTLCLTRPSARATRTSWPSRSSTLRRERRPSRQARHAITRWQGWQAKPFALQNRAVGTFEITRNRTSARNGAAGIEFGKLSELGAVRPPLRRGRCLDSPDGRTLADLPPRRNTQAITRGDYLHKQNSFLIHGEQANSRPRMAEPYSVLLIRNRARRLVEHYEPMKAFPLPSPIDEC